MTLQRDFRNQNQPAQRPVPPVPQVYNPPGYPTPYPMPTGSATSTGSPSASSGTATGGVLERLLHTKVRKKLMTLVVSGLILFLNDILELGIERSTIAYFVGIAATFILGQGIADMGKERAVIQAQMGTADHVSYEVEVEGGASANFASGNSSRPATAVYPQHDRIPLNPQRGQQSHG